MILLLILLLVVKRAALVNVVARAESLVFEESVAWPAASGTRVLLQTCPTLISSHIPSLVSLSPPHSLSYVTSFAFVFVFVLVSTLKTFV